MTVKRDGQKLQRPCGIVPGVQLRGQSLANFIADVRQNGFAAAAERAGLGDLSGKSAGDILNTLLDRLGGNASSIDDADARQALSDLQQELLADAQTFEEVQEILSSDTLDLENL